MTYITYPIPFHIWWIATVYILYVEAAGHTGTRLYWTPAITSPILSYFGMELILEDQYVLVVSSSLRNEDTNPSITVCSVISTIEMAGASRLTTASRPGYGTFCSVPLDRDLRRYQRISIGIYENSLANMYSTRLGCNRHFVVMHDSS